MVPGLGRRDLTGAKGLVGRARLPYSGRAERKMPRGQVRPLRSIMHDLGHEWISILKIDIEGFEFSVFTDVSASAIIEHR